MRIRFAFLILSVPLWAQDSLSLKEAIQTALRSHPAVEASRSGMQAADMRVQAARSGYLPKINYSESFQRTNNPVYVFSSLLMQRRFSEQNFALGSLNHPGPLNNFQSQLTLDQHIYDAGLTKNAVRSAELGRNISSEEERRTEMDVIANVVRAYHGAVLAAENLKVADEAVRSASVDASRALAIRQAGMSTDADVLSIEVHLAAMKEQQIRRRSDLDIARAALNNALGLPLDTQHTLTTPLTPAYFEDLPLEQYEGAGVKQRPEMQQARLAANLAEVQGASARAAYLPQVVVHAGLEADRQRFVTRGGASWVGAVSLRWNLFNGFADRARISEAAFGLSRARTEMNQVESGVRLDVRRAYAELRSAEQRIEVAKAAVAMAEESLRITKNRYENGLSNVTELLRNETSLLESRTRYLAAVYDQRLAAANLALATGSLTPASNALN